MSKFVVTGAAGFIGLNTCQYLLEKGHKVLGIDNFSTSCPVIYETVLEQLKKYTDFSFEELDLCEGESTNKLIREYKPDYIIHLAAIPSVARSVEDPLKSIKNNTISTTNIALAAVSCNVKKLVYAASSSYYGGISSNHSNLDERYPLCKSPYAASKAAGEIIIKSFHYTYNLPTVALRYFNVFGPYQNPKTQYSAVIPAFVSKLLNNEYPIIYGDGSQSRDFTFIKNVTYANFIACVGNVSGRTFDIGCGNNTSLISLLKSIKKIMGIDKETIFEKTRSGDVLFSQANILSAQCFLGYEPIVSLENGLIEAINYYEDNKDILGL